MYRGVRLVAGFSALGIAAAFLTGCSGKNPDESGKDPDEGLCEEVTAAIESRGIDVSAPDSGSRLYAGLPPEEVSKVGKEIRAAAQKYKESNYAELMDIIGETTQLLGEERGATDEVQRQEKVRQLQESSKRFNLLPESEFARWGKKCQAFSGVADDDE